MADTTSPIMCSAYALLHERIKCPSTSFIT